MKRCLILTVLGLTACWHMETATVPSAPAPVVVHTAPPDIVAPNGWTKAEYLPDSGPEVELLGSWTSEIIEGRIEAWHLEDEYDPERSAFKMIASWNLADCAFLSMRRLRPDGYLLKFSCMDARGRQDRLQAVIPDGGRILSVAGGWSVVAEQEGRVAFNAILAQLRPHVTPSAK